MIDGWGISCKIALIWMSLDFAGDQSTLVQVMARCRQATSHYLSQCWPRSVSPYGVIRPQWGNCHWWVWVQRFHHWMRCWCNHVSRRNHWGEILICNQFTTIFNCTKLLTSTSDSVAYTRPKSLIMTQAQLVSSVFIIALEFLLNQSEFEWCHL